MAYIVAPRKITHYLLADATAEAAGKRKFFTSIGYRLENWQTLQAALAEHPAIATPTGTRPDIGFGEKHIFLCHLPPAPNGRTYCIRSVWMRRGADFHFVTAYPQPPPA